jgi:hypothetical protein
MEAFLKVKDGKKIDLLYAHNDDMAIGAIQAIEEAGHEAGQGHLDRLHRWGASGAFEAMKAGKLNVTVECNPLLGPQLMQHGQGCGRWQGGAQGAVTRGGRRVLPADHRRGRVAQAQILMQFEAPPPVLELVGIDKRFGPSVKALRGVSLRLLRRRSARA